MKLFSKLLLLILTLTYSGLVFSAARIQDADIKAGAAIARSKMANGTADHVVINSGAGAFSSEAQLAGTRGGTGASNAGTFTYGANNITLTTSGVTGVTLPTTGTLATLAGNETLTNKTINASNNTVTNVSLTTGVTGVLPVANGGTNGNTATAGFDNLAPTTSKGDIIVHDGTDNIRIAVGANDTVLTADSAQASGVKWASVSAGTTVWWARIDCTSVGSTCSVSSQGPTNWISSVTYGSVGAYTVNFSGGIFGSAPACVGAVYLSGTNGIFVQTSGTTTSAISIDIWDGTTTHREARFSLNCPDT